MTTPAAGSRLFVVAAALGTVGALVAGVAELTSGPAALAFAGRWMVVAGLCAYGLHKRSLTTWILVSMVVGAEIGHDWPDLCAPDPARGMGARALSQVFLRMIKTIIAPLIFSTLVVGIAGHSSLRQVGRMGVKAMVYFEIVTTLALFIGLGAINLTQAGAGVVHPAKLETAPSVAKPQTLGEIVVHAFPENVAKSVAEGQVLQIVVFSVLFAIALAMLPEAKRRPLLTLAESLSETMFKFTNIVMLFAPVGVGAAIAYTVGHLGLGILFNLAKLLVTLYLALLFFMVAVLLPVALIFRVPLRAFARAVAEPVSIAFATTSSEAALPLAMEKMEELGVPKQIVAFVMPTGYSFNLDGSTLYLALASIFVAQAAAIPLTFGQQLQIVFTLMLTSKGVAGVPRATLVILLGTAASFNLPEWPILAIMGIDELMDMARTSVNVIGNCLATVVVARSEGQFQVAEPIPPAAAPSVAG